ncbi:hypothetical protein HCN44_001452 [Aphidius gifuensis]|uniref:Peptidase A1 domain-containing protein n=1 Tax=Aphidius gifuensis TaxID=684658 RepID=A0A834XT62_APHGI|nr:lysosomal aspartic protease-like [Aphidius gifuensis]KAF7992127.1 hypothetical protein HCN44_001452 [Aphidius gifuensis]
MFINNFLLLIITTSIIHHVICDPLKIDLYNLQHDYTEEKLIKYDEVLHASNPGYDTVVLYKFLNAEYYGEIGIGYPKQTFKVIFDTTWADTFVPSQQCGFTEWACMMHTRYDHTKSSTYRANGATFERADSEMSLKGFLSVDDFHLAHLKVVNQTFIEMTHLSLKPFGATKADGIVGLGFDSLAVKGAKPFFYNMINQNIVKENIFTFYMNIDETTNKAGRLILGGTERSHVKGNLTFLPVTSKDYWSVSLDRMIIQTTDKSKTTYTFCDNGCSVMMDTSANTISGPAEVVKKINNILGAKEILPTWPYKSMVDCRGFSKLPHVTFVFAGRNFTIESKYYVQHLTYMGMQICLSPFVISPQNYWEIGGAFLMQFYTEFNIDKRTIAIGETLM